MGFDRCFPVMVFVFTQLLLLPVVQAHPVDEQHQPGKVTVLLLAENTNTPPADETVMMDGLSGPAQTSGIASVYPLGIIELDNEFPAMQGRQLRARIFTIEPGGQVGIHTHNQRPGYAYILSGRIVEHRNDHPEPLLREAGEIAMEKNGVTHWWENIYDEPVKALVVDIFTPEQ